MEKYEIKKTNKEEKNEEQVYAIRFKLHGCKIFEQAFKPYDSIKKVIDTFKEKMPKELEGGSYLLKHEGEDFGLKEDRTVIEVLQPDLNIVEVLYTGFEVPLSPKEAYFKSVSVIGSPVFNSHPLQVITYNKKEQTIRTVKLQFDKKIVDNLSCFSAYCNGADRLFISGGESEGENGQADNSGTFLCYNFNSNEEFELPDLQVPRSWHSMLYVPKRYVFIVGGLNERSTEVFDLERFTLKRGPDMVEPRAEPSLCLSNEGFLYVFFGMDEKNNFNSTIERLNLRIKDSVFELIEVSLPESFSPRFFCLSYASDASKVILFGSEDQRSENYVLDFSSGEITENPGELKNKKRFSYSEKFFLPMDIDINLMLPSTNSKTITYVTENSLNDFTLRQEGEIFPQLNRENTKKIDFFQPKESLRTEQEG